MRVIAGSAKGRRLVAPDGQTTRPTGDRVKESVFNALVSMGEVEEAIVVDLFAGSGALGIEALSRGAERAIFIERDRRAIDAIQQNLTTLGFTDRATVVTGDVFANAARLADSGLGPVDLILADPPYEFDEWERLLSALPPVLVVAESENPVRVGEDRSIMREKRYGATLVTFITTAHRQLREDAPTP